MGIDPELRALRITRTIVPLSIDPITASILLTTLPGDHEITVCIYGSRGIQLIRCRIGIDPELQAQKITRTVVPLGIDPITVSILAIITLPGDHEITTCIHGDRGIRLRRYPISIDPELRVRGMGAWN
jgi:hypothetical protein